MRNKSEHESRNRFAFVKMTNCVDSMDSNERGYTENFYEAFTSLNERWK